MGLKILRKRVAFNPFLSLVEEYQTNYQNRFDKILITFISILDSTQVFQSQIRERNELEEFH